MEPLSLSRKKTKHTRCTKPKKLTFISWSQQTKIYRGGGGEEKTCILLLLLIMIKMFLFCQCCRFSSLSRSLSRARAHSLTAHVRLLLVRCWISDLGLQEDSNNECEHKYLYVFLFFEDTCIQ